MSDTSQAPSAGSAPRKSERQRAHYDTIKDQYDAHYFDESSLAYRDRFIIDPLLDGLDLNHKDVADLACGSGHVSAAIRHRFPDVRLAGFDISPRACASYRTLIGSPAHELDLTAPGLPAGITGMFDAAIVVGGLHHCIADLPTTLQNIASLLKPGGLLLMAEPSADFWLQMVRRLWYRLDRYFDSETEDALSHDTVLARAGEWFERYDVRYMGGPGYFLILNSLLLRFLTLPAKRVIAPPLIWADGWVNRIPGRALFPYFLARWRRRATAM